MATRRRRRRRNRRATRPEFDEQFLAGITHEFETIGYALKRGPDFYGEGGAHAPRLNDRRF